MKFSLLKTWVWFEWMKYSIMFGECCIYSSLRMDFNVTQKTRSGKLLQRVITILPNEMKFQDASFLNRKFKVEYSI